jgi:hypothetical protein
LWINGAFGAGKSTTAGLLLESVEGARLFDPEYVGYLLRRFVPVPTGDFQAVLVVPEPVLREHIDNDANDPSAREWRQDHVPSAVAELPGVAGREPDTHEIDATRTPDEIVADLLVHIGQTTHLGQAQLHSDRVSPRRGRPASRRSG